MPPWEFTWAEHMTFQGPSGYVHVHVVPIGYDVVVNRWVLDKPVRSVDHKVYMYKGPFPLRTQPKETGRTPTLVDFNGIYSTMVPPSRSRLRWNLGRACEVSDGRCGST